MASLPKNSYCTTALWVKSCGCFSAGSSARGVVPSLSDPWWRKGWWRVSQERALGIVGTTVLSLCSLLPQLTLSGVPVVISVSYLISYFLCSFRRSRRQSGALAHLINTARLKALRSRGRASFCEPAWVFPNPILEDIGTNQRGSSVFVKKSLSGTEHRGYKNQS